MPLSGNQKLLILVVVVVVILYLVYMQKEGADSVAPTITPTIASTVASTVTPTVTPTVTSTISQSNLVENPRQNLVTPIILQDPTLMQSQTDKLLLDKMTTKNTANGSEYKKISYTDGNRDSKSQNLDDFFDQGNPLSDNENSAFLPNDTSAGFASYSGKPRKELSDDEKFNASALLPQEEKQDWFEDVTPQKIKNRHLINIYRPIGVNTVITSRKNGSLDLRGNPVNPKTFVSPFLNSSIDPDVNARGICT
jgi:hypothetical protein